MHDIECLAYNKYPNGPRKNNQNSVVEDAAAGAGVGGVAAAVGATLVSLKE